ncbi:MAG: hypothetical protein JW793_06175 [Acidobacteria bacterium]|nr:hypothetical protein [Acidobacteriota bacterium]
MKLHFEPNLDYRLQAIEAVCDLFRGQETAARSSRSRAPAIPKTRLQWRKVNITIGKAGVLEEADIKLYEQEELTGYLKNLLDARKSVYEQVVYDSGTEAAFADQLEKNSGVKVYAKRRGRYSATLRDAACGGRKVRRG